MRAPTQLRKSVIKKTSFPLPSQLPIFLFWLAQTPTLPMRPTLSTRAKKRVEKSPSTTQHCSLSGRFLGYSLREFGLRRPLEMTCIGNVVSIALTVSDISILSRVNADVTVTPDVKYAS